MSGSNDERPTAAKDTVVADPAPESPPTEEPVEMSAAEALARVTAAAAEPAAGPDTTVESAADVAEVTAAAEGAAEALEPGAKTAESVAPTETEPPAEDAAETEPPAEAATEEEPPTEAAAETESPAEAATEEEPPTEAAAETESPAEAPAAVDAAVDPAPETPPEAPEGSAAEPAKEVAEEATVEAETPSAPEPTESAAEAAKEEAEPADAVAATAAEPAAEATEPATDDDATAPEPAPDAPSAKPPSPDRPELRAVREAMENRQPLEGRVIGWNQGGFHLALGELSAFCPRSEMEVGEVAEPESYLDRTFQFRVLRLQGKGRRIVVSRAAHLRNEKTRQRSVLRKKLRAGTELDGVVASLKDFGAFVDLGGAQGLVHVSEISHRRVEHPSDVLSEGQEVRVKVLKVEQGGRRISLSMRALEPDPWKDLADRFPRGAVVKGTVEKANQFGAFIELAPGLTGLLPARSMSIPRETSPARAYPPGKEVSVQIVAVDPRRQRISLALEGSGLEGSRNDYKEYQQRQRRDTDDGGGFNALASAFRRLQDGAD